MPPIACPSRSRLSEFNLGRLPEEDLEAIAEHLERCGRCEAALKELDGEPDAVVASLRGLSALNGMPYQPSSPMTLPTRLGSYEVLSELGRGAMGIVYQARHSELRRVVALKMLLGGEFAREENRTRFRAEAEAVARLQHPNIIQIFELGEWRANDLGPPCPYLTLEFVDGGNLGSRLAGNPQSPALAAQWLLTLAHAVHYAHGQGIVHRDLKPSNVLLTADGRLKLCDFGVAKLVTGSGLDTLGGQLVGTPEYMAPEQADGQGRLAGPVSDVYGLGGILYTMLTGRPAFQSPSVLGTLEQVLSREPIAPRRLQPAVPRDLETICLKCLQKEPRRRYASAAQLAEDLERYLDGRAIMARPTGWVDRCWKWSRRRPAVALLSAATVAVTILSFILIAWQWRRAEYEATAQAAAKVEAEQLGRKAIEGQTELALNHGLDLCSRGEVGHGLLWMARSLELAEGAAIHGLDRATRINLADWAGQFSQPRWTVQNSGPILDLAFSRDGRTLVSVGKDRNIRTWDTDSGRESGAPLKPAEIREDQWVSRVALNPRDGRMVVTVEEGNASFWDLERRTRTGPSLSHPSEHVIWGLAFSPDGRKLVTCCDDGAARWWDVTTGNRIGEPLWHGDEAGYYTLALSPDGRTLVTGGKDLRAVRWDVETGRQIGTPLMHKSPVHMIAFLRDGRRVVTGTRDGGLRIWDTATDQVTDLPPQGSSVTGLASSPDGRLMVTGTAGGYLRIWDTTTLRPTGPTYKLSSAVTGLTFHPDGHSLAIGQDDGTIRLWAVPRLRSLGSPIKAGSAVHGLAFSPDGQSLLTSSSRGSQRWDLNGNPLGPLMDSRRYEPDGKVLSEDGGRTYDIVDFIEATAVSPDRRTFAVARWAGNERHVRGCAEVWDLATGTRLHKTVEQPLPLAGVVYHPNSTQLLTWDAQPRSALLWDVPGLRSGRPIIRSLNSPIRQAVFSPDGKTLLLACRDGTARLWDIARDQEIIPERRPDHGYPMTAVAFDPLGPRIVTGCQAGTLGIWNLTKGLLIRDIRGNADEVTSLTFSPDGRSLLTASYDGTARFWDVESGQQLGPPLRHTDAVLCAIFHPDGRSVVTGTKDGIVQRWQAPLPPLEGSVDQVRLAVEIQTGMSMDQQGAIHTFPTTKQ
ncbi:protein kinase domain-containing protein [Singulisphaera acidiphila]|nr:protein kinase [Singulisphaera acidiphila]